MTDESIARDKQFGATGSDPTYKVGNDFTSPGAGAGGLPTIPEPKSDAAAIVKNIDEPATAGALRSYLANLTGADVLPLGQAQALLSAYVGPAAGPGSTGAAPLSTAQVVSRMLQDGVLQGTVTAGDPTWTLNVKALNGATPSTMSPTTLRINVKKEDGGMVLLVEVTDPVLIAKIQAAAEAGDFDTVADLVGPLVTDDPAELAEIYGQDPEGLTQDLIDVSGSKTGTEGSDFTVSFTIRVDSPTGEGWVSDRDLSLDFTVPPEVTTVSLSGGRSLTVDYGDVAFTAQERAALETFDWAGAGDDNIIKLEAKMREGLGDALVDKLEAITVIDEGNGGTVLGAVAPDHSTGDSPYGWLGLDGAGIGADMRAIAAEAPIAAPIAVDVDGYVTGATPEDISRDAAAEAVFTLGQGLVSATDGQVPSDWSEADYVAFALGFNGLGDLTGTAAWDNFVTTNLPPGAPPKPVSEMDLSMFDTLFPGGTESLTTLIEDGLVLHDTMNTMEAQGATTFEADTFEASHDAGAAQGGRQLFTDGLRNRFRPLSQVEISTARTEASAAVKGYKYASTATKIGEVAGTAEAGTTAGTTAVAVGSTAIKAAGSIVFVAGLSLANIYQSQKLIDETPLDGVVDKPGYGPEAQNGSAEILSSPPTYRRKYEAGYLAASAQFYFNSQGAAGAATFLLQSEAKGSSAPALEAALDSLPDSDRAMVEKALVDGVGGDSYYDALQTGRKYSGLEDRAFAATDGYESAFSGLVTQAPASGSEGDNSTRTSGYDIAQRLQSMPPATAIALIKTWAGALSGRDASDYTRFNEALATLSQQAPDLMLSAAAAIYRASPTTFGRIIEGLVDSGNPDAASALLQGLKVPDQAVALAQASGITVPDLQAAVTQPEGLAGKVMAALPPEAKSDLAAFLDGLGLAQGQAEAFMDLTNPADRAAFLGDLEAHATLTEGSSAEATVSAAQALLLAQLSPEEAAQVIVERLYPTDGSISAEDAGKAITDLFKFQGPQLANKTVTQINLELTKRGKDPVDIGGEAASPIKNAVQDYIDSGPLTDTAAFIAEMDPAQAANLLASLEPGQAAYALQMMVNQGKTDQAGAIVQALAEMSPATAASIIQVMDSGTAAQILATLDPAMAKSILFEMPDQIAALILAEMEPGAVTNIFALKTDEDYEKMLGIVLLMGNCSSRGAAVDQLADVPRTRPQGTSPDDYDIPVTDQAQIDETGQVQQNDPIGTTGVVAPPPPPPTPASLSLSDGTTIYGYERVQADGTTQFLTNLENPPNIQVVPQEKQGTYQVVIARSNGKEVFVLLEPGVPSPGPAASNKFIILPGQRSDGRSGPRPSRLVTAPRDFNPERIDQGIEKTRITRAEVGEKFKAFAKRNFAERQQAAEQKRGNAPGYENLKSAEYYTSAIGRVENIFGSPNPLSQILVQLTKWIGSGAAPDRDDVRSMIGLINELTPMQAGVLPDEQRILILDFAMRSDVALTGQSLEILTTRRNGGSINNQSSIGNPQITRMVNGQTEEIIRRIAASFPDLTTSELTEADLDELIKEVIAITADVYGIEPPVFTWSTFGLNFDEQGSTVASARPPSLGDTGLLSMNIHRQQHFIEHPAQLINFVVHEMTHMYQFSLKTNMDSYVYGSAESQLAMMVNSYYLAAENNPSFYKDNYLTVWVECHAYYVGDAVQRAFEPVK